MQKIQMTVAGMHCAGCVGAVRDAITGVDAEAEVEISLAERQVVAETKAEPEALVEVITRLGYEVEASRRSAA